MFNPNQSNMKRFIAIACSSLLVVVISSCSFEAPRQKAGLTPSIENPSISHLDLAYINDAVSPAVAPLYGPCVYVHALNVSLTGTSLEVYPASNSPPLKKAQEKTTT